jgi:hypothetical protein
MHHPSLAAATMICVLTATASGAVLTATARDSTIESSTITLGPTPGYIGGGFNPLATVSGSVIDSAADLTLSGDLYYGPDMFGRLYEGGYEGTQDVTFSAMSLAASLDQSASTTVLDPGNPAASSLRSSVVNTYIAEFALSESTEIELTISFTGTTQSGGAADAVGYRIRALDANGNPQISSLFELAFVAGSGSTSTGVYSTQLFLDPGFGYQIEAFGRATAEGTSGVSSELSFSMMVVCAGDTNGDNIVNFTDLNTVLAQFGQSGMGLAGDVTGDALVNFADLNKVLANFGNACD